MAQVVHGTLTANTMADVDLNSNAATVEVLNVDGAAAIYFTVDGDDPTVEGTDCHVIPAAIGALIVRSWDLNETHVKLISAGTPKYSVRVV